MIYNRTVSETEVKQLYYDNVSDVLIGTNSGTHSELNLPGAANLSFDKDAALNSVIITVLKITNIGSVTVADYNISASPLNINVTVTPFKPFATSTSTFKDNWSSMMGIVGVILLLMLIAVIVQVIRRDSSSLFTNNLTATVSGIVFVVTLLLVGTIIFSQLS